MYKIMLLVRDSETKPLWTEYREDGTVFETDDMDAVIRILQENHIEILDGPNEIPDSEQWIYFMDPDMNVLEYIVWMNREKSGGN